MAFFYEKINLEDIKEFDFYEDYKCAIKPYNNNFNYPVFIRGSYNQLNITDEELHQSYFTIDREKKYYLRYAGHGRHDDGLGGVTFYIFNKNGRRIYFSTILIEKNEDIYKMEFNCRNFKGDYICNQEDINLIKEALFVYKTRNFTKKFEFELEVLEVGI